MSVSSANNKRIAKNTLFLYARMMFLMLITFFTSRVILDKLGVVDYGIYNVVGGLASMFTFFRSSLSNATQRYLSMALGKGDMEEAGRIFCQHQTLYGMTSIFIIGLSEIVGLWLLKNKLVISPDRQVAAFWVFQFTVISLAFTLLSIVYDSVLIAREEMKVYSYVGIVEGVAKLAIAYFISIFHFDRLIFYGFLLSSVSVGLVMFYAFYCSKHFPEATYRFLWNKTSIKETFSFISWNVIGTAAWAINDQGINILLNMFFGPAINAARGIAFQINQALNHFTASFFTAVRPQIIKSYASEDLRYLFRLLFSSSKFSFYLLWYLALPVMLHIDGILAIWLKDVPSYTNIFTIWVLVFSLVNTTNNPIWTLALAIGKLKWYIIIGSSVFLLTFPIAYIVLKMGYPPVSVFVVSTIVRAIYVLVVLLVIKRYIVFSLWDYLTNVIIPVLFVVMISGTISFLIKDIYGGHFVGILLTAVSTTIIISFSILLFGLNKPEREKIMAFTKRKIS